LFQRQQRRRFLPHQQAGFLDHRILARGQIIRQIIRAGRGVQRRQYAADNIIDMHPAEHLIGQIDAPGFTLSHPVERAAARPVDARQAEHPCTPLQPCKISLGAGVPAPFS